MVEKTIAVGSLAMLLACAPESPAPAVSAPDEPSRIAILATLSGDVDASSPAVRQAAAPSDPAPSSRPATIPPSKWCTCDPPAATFTPEQRVKLANVQKLVDMLNAHGRTKDAAALQKELDDVAAAALQKCTAWCAEQGR
jgi:hypothetical protein